MAHAISRLLSWGMTVEERRQFLSESLADWEAMGHDQRPWNVLLRAVRGIPAAIWIRLSDREITSMPAGVAITLVGIGGITAGARSSAYPAPFRQFAILTSLGLVLVGINFVREPRRIVLRRYRAAGSIAAIGFIGSAANLPTAAQWPYSGPVLEHRLMDSALQVSFVIIAIAFLLLVAASFLPAHRRLVLYSGVALSLGIATLGVTQVGWGIGMAPIDLTMTVASIVIGLGALSFVHVLPRLRHLDIVAELKDENTKTRQPRKGAS
jgi:hypothetical protein